MAGPVSRAGGRRASRVKEQFWREHVRRQAAGTLSVRRYCERHELSEPSFYAWRRELARRDALALRPAAVVPRRNEVAEQPAEFLRVHLQPEAAGGKAPIEIVLPGELRVLVPAGATRGQVRDVLSALGVVPAGEERTC